MTVHYKESGPMVITRSVPELLQALPSPSSGDGGAQKPATEVDSVRRRGFRYNIIEEPSPKVHGKMCVSLYIHIYIYLSLSLFYMYT